MTYTRDQMQSALKQTVMPHLRSAGFKGSLPNFYRLTGDRVDLLGVQYYSSGGCLLIEIASAKDDGTREPAKQRVHFHGKRLRLHRDSNRNHHWFCYTPSGMFSPMQAPKEIAEQLTELIKTQAESWWAEQRQLGS